MQPLYVSTVGSGGLISVDCIATTGYPEIRNVEREDSQKMKLFQSKRSKSVPYLGQRHLEALNSSSNGYDMPFFCFVCFALKPNTTISIN